MRGQRGAQVRERIGGGVVQHEARGQHDQQRQQRAAAIEQGVLVAAKQVQLLDLPGRVGAGGEGGRRHGGKNGGKDAN
ncbi:hypothetical protein D9M72_657080 [compost metagenome]